MEIYGEMGALTSFTIYDTSLLCGSDIVTDVTN